MSRIIVANDTSSGPNPGCRAVMTALSSLPGLQDALRLPLGLWADAFRPIASQSRAVTVRSPTRFPYGTDRAPPLNLERWCEIVDEVARHDAELWSQLRSASILLINGEGSIHHNLPRALALLALMRTALLTGTRTILVNTTIQAMYEPLLSDVLPDLSFIHTREGRTADLLGRLGVQTRCGPDLAFLAIPRGELVAPRPEGKTCLVTAGVLAGSGQLPSIFERVRALGLDPIYLRVGDGGEGPAVAAACAASSVSVVEAGALSPGELLAFLSRAYVAVSGRHHVNIYLLSAGTPFVALPSNTWKIEATLNDLGSPFPVAGDADELEDKLARVVADRDRLSAAARALFRSGQDQAVQIRSEIATWIS